MASFSARLTAALRQRKTPLVVGIDPHWALLPGELTQDIQPTDRPQVVQRIDSFCRGVIDVVAPLVPAIKPQWAFFEQWGSGGQRVLEGLIQYAQSRGLLVLADAKRGDIGSTATAYAATFFGLTERSASPTDWPICDALTVSPYLGLETLQPFVERARAVDAGLFVLVKTSNPGSGEFQDLTTSNGERLYEIVARHVDELAQQSAGPEGYGDVGAVVGATYFEQLSALRARLAHSWILVPGFGVQGGSAADVAGAFDSRGLGALINSSRGVIFAQRQAEFRHVADWQTAVEQACRQAIDALGSETPAGRLRRD